MAHLVDNRETVLVLAGYIATATNEDGTERTELRFSDDAAVEVPADLHDFLLYMQTPRRKSDVYAWLHDNGGKRVWVPRLLRDWWLISVHPSSYKNYLTAFNGLCIIPTCYFLKGSDRFDDVFHVTTEEEAPKVRPLSTLLQRVIWESLDGEDVPTAAARMSVPDEEHKLAPPVAYTDEQKAKMILGDLDLLLTNKYVRLERVKKDSLSSGWLKSLMGKNATK
jgi:hypothetical protein